MSFGTTLIRGILISFLFAKGYFYLNICAGLFSGLYFLLNYKHFKSKFAAGCARFLIFIGPSLILYILLNLDGLIQLKELYSGLNGDLFVPEPRIRSLKTNVYYYFEGGWETILSFISAKLVKTGSWLTGLLYMTPFFLVALFGIRRTELKDPIIRLSLGLLGFGFLMSYKSFLAVMINNHVPIFNSNRWSHVNLIFAEIGALIIIAVILREKWNSSSSFLLSSLKKCALVILLLSNYLFFNGEIKEQRSYSELEKATNFSDRPIYPSITQNNRRLGVSQDFSIYDIRWLTEKAPFTHGYFNTVHYIYWYLKDALFLEKLVNFQSTYKVELPIPSKIKSDNKMVQFRLDQVDTTGSQYLLLNDTPGIASQRTPFYQVEEFLILPNEARFKVSTQGAGLFTFYNQWAPGWVAHVNGVESKIFLANLLFKAVELPEQGIYEISFKYKPVTIKFLYIYYSIIALFFLGYLYKKNFR